MKDKNKLIKFVKKHPNLSTFLMGTGALATGASIIPLQPAVGGSLMIGGSAGILKGEIEGLEEYLKKHYGKKKIGKVV